MREACPACGGGSGLLNACRACLGTGYARLRCRTCFTWKEVTAAWMVLFWLPFFLLIPFLMLMIVVNVRLLDPLDRWWRTRRLARTLDRWWCGK